jgi:hypothetical protein
LQFIALGRSEALVAASLIEISLFNSITDGLGRRLKLFSQMVRKASGTDQFD